MMGTALATVLFWVAIGALGLIVILPAIAGPIIVYFHLRFRPSAPLNPLFPHDPRWAAGVPWFFGEVWSQVEPLGFRPAVYLFQEGMAPNSTMCVALFSHEANRDVATAIVALATGGGISNCSSFVAEFSSDSADGRLNVNTNNVGDPSGVYSLDRKKVLKIPGMRDLAALYRIHLRHLESVGVREKSALPKPHAWSDELTKCLVREFDDLEKVGCCRRMPDGETYRMRLAAAIVCTHRLVPGIIQLNRARLRWKARRWLKANGFSHNYQAVDFKAMAKRHATPVTALPAPEWYPSANPVASAEFRQFRCTSCHQTIASNEAPGVAVQCPMCMGTVIVPADDRSNSTRTHGEL